MRDTELICVNCPKGCRVTVHLEDDKIAGIEGYSCKEGLNYAEQEITRPMRILTSTVRIDGAVNRVLPVITESDIPLDIWREAMREIKKLRVIAPVEINDVIVSDFMGTGVNLIASRSMSMR